MVDTDDTRRTTNDGRRTTPRVWHKLPTGELKTKANAPGNKKHASQKKFEQGFPFSNWCDADTDEDADADICKTMSTPPHGGGVNIKGRNRHSLIVFGGGISFFSPVYK